MNTPGSVAGGWLAFFGATIIGMYHILVDVNCVPNVLFVYLCSQLRCCVSAGFVVGRDQYGKKKEYMLAKEERERQTFDQKMASWDQESKAKALVKANNETVKNLKPVPITSTDSTGNSDGSKE